MLDAGALIALDRGDKRMVALLNRALSSGRTFRIPAGVIGQAWRNGRLQASLSHFLRCGQVTIVPMDGLLARACGELCAATNSSDVIDASVVIVAREKREPIITSDPNDLRRLDPSADLIAI